MERKTSLTGREKVLAAAARLVFGTEDSAIALILGVTNNGRVNEGIKQVLSSVGEEEPGYKQKKGSDEPELTIEKLLNEKNEKDPLQ